MTHILPSFWHSTLPERQSCEIRPRETPMILAASLPEMYSANCMMCKLHCLVNNVKRIVLTGVRFLCCSAILGMGKAMEFLLPARTAVLVVRAGFLVGEVGVCRCEQEPEQGPA